VDGPSTCMGVSVRIPRTLENPHTCNGDYITDYWGVWEGQNGPFLRVVHALRSEDVKPAYMKYADTRKAVKNAGGATVRRLTKSRALGLS
jgi:hypothetical protein